MADDQKKIEFYEHPEYVAKHDDWETYRDLYEGDHKRLISPRYLWPHELEGSTAEAGRDPVSGAVWTVGEKLRTIRTNRSRYLNITEPIVSNWISILFKKEMRIDEAVTKMLGDDAKDITGDGISFEDFIKGPIATAYFRDGRPMILVDAPQGTFTNLADQQQAGHRPYMSVLDVLCVKDWQVVSEGEEKGKLEWLRYEYSEIEKRNSPQEEPVKVDYCKVLILNEKAYVQELYAKKEKDGWESRGAVPIAGEWDSLPVTTVWNNEPWVKDIASLQLVLFNLMSAWYNQLNSQAFQRIFIAGNMGEQHQIAISEYTVAKIPDGAVTTVIEPSSTDALTSACDRTINQMYQVAFNRTRSIAGDSKEAPGAETIREMNEELVTLLITAMGEIESVVNQALVEYAKFKGIKDFKAQITLDKDLTVEDVQAEMETFAAYRTDIVRNLPWHKAHLKKVATRMKYGDDETKEIMDEIDGMKEIDPLDPLGAMKPFMGGVGGKENEQQVQNPQAAKVPSNSKN